MGETTIRKEKEEAIDASKIQASLVWKNNDQQGVIIIAAATSDVKDLYL
jgi:hypothetical protein